MAVKQRKTTSATKQSGSARTTQKKRAKKQSSKKRSSPGLMTKATEAVHAVIAAASGAVQGAVEAGKAATGIGEKRTKTRAPRRS
jgi:hypothetical protein